MYVTAHHVVNKARQLEGLNAFHYAHEGLTWTALPPPGIPDDQPGVLTRQQISVRPGGNHVRSYLDIVAPDGTPWSEIEAAFVSFLAKRTGEPLPWKGVVGRTVFRVGMDLGLVAQRHRELAQLLRAAKQVASA